MNRGQELGVEQVEAWKIFNVATKHTWFLFLMENETINAEKKVTILEEAYAVVCKQDHKDKAMVEEKLNLQMEKMNACHAAMKINHIALKQLEDETMKQVKEKRYNTSGDKFVQQVISNGWYGW